VRFLKKTVTPKFIFQKIRICMYMTPDNRPLNTDSESGWKWKNERLKKTDVSLGVTA
jgi:hypothetical protein